MKRILEIACFNSESCLIAQNSGADRIEFCSNYLNGGVTPSQEEILKIRRLINIPLFVIIRPRGGNFVFNEEEKEKIKTDILFCKENKIDGIVTGALTYSNKPDVHFIKELISLAFPLPFTFHRAIDDCENTNESVQALIDLGVKRILSSGGNRTAIEGKNKLKELQQIFGNKIIIVPGGGVRSDAILEIMNFTGCSEFHSSGISNDSETTDSNEITKLKTALAQ